MSSNEICILVSKDEEERAHWLSYSFQYLKLIMEIFPVFLENSKFYTFNASIGESSFKKIKMDIRQDDFLKDNSLTDLTEIGKAIHGRISDWNNRYMGMSFNKSNFFKKVLI